MATQQSALELKQQGAIEAAQNPNSSVTAQDAEKKMVEESKNAGVAAYSFDPNASPEEKRRQVRSAIPGELRPHRQHNAVAITTDADDGGPKADYLPEASKPQVAELDQDEHGKPIEDDRDALAAKVGWTQQFGWPHDSVLEGESLLDHQTWLEGKIPDKFYGDWYHNAAVIVFACLSSWLIAVLGGGLSWVFIIMAICATHYRTSLRRVRRNFRDDITREMGLKRLDSDTESLEWINAFLLKFWPIYQPVLAETIINSVDQVLSSATPAFLDSLKLKTFTLGSKPPRMEHVKTYPKEEDDTVVMDWKFSFTPNDIADMTTKQIKNKINPKVVLEIRVGKAMISKGLDVIVEDMAFSGLMRLKLKLQFPFPHIEKIEMCFMERPTIDYVCKPLGGDTFGFDINFIPGLESFILEQIHGNLAPMMYHPHVFPIEVAKMLAGTPVDQAIGVVAVTIHSAQGLKNPDNFSGDPDAYVSLTLNRRTEIARTRTIKDNTDPKWNEVHYVIITSFNDSLDLMVYDFNEFRKDKELGVAAFKLENVEDVPVHENQRLEIIGNGKARGVLSADIRFFPVLEPTKLEDGSVQPPPESNTGILRYTVEQAKDLDGTKSLVGLLNPYAELLLNRKVVHTTKKLKRTNNPIWDNGSKEMLITDRKKAELGLAIKDDRDLAGDQLIGAHNIKLDDLLEMSSQGKDWFLLSGAKSGRVKVTAQWKPVALSGVLAGSGGYQTPIGVMRLHFKNARELRNFETMGKSDPYVRVVVSGIEKGRTVVHRNTLNPEWDEVLYVPVHSPRDRLTLDVMDAEKMGKDRSLGLIELLASDYVVQDESGEYQVHDQKSPHEDGLRLHGKGVAKGVLCYSVAFYPCLNVADPEDEEEEGDGAGAADAVSEAPQQSLDVPRSSDAGKITPLERTMSNASQREPTTPLSPTMPKSPTTPTTIGRKSRDIPREVPKVHLTPEELLKHESGFLIFKLMEGQMPKSGTHLEVYVDDMSYPSYVSGTAKSKSFKFDEIGDCFVRELEFSRLTLKVREKREKPGEERDEDHTIARLSGNTLDTLKQCLNNPTILRLKDEENRDTYVKVSLKYIPVKMQLDPSESINNMGNLRVDVLDAEGLPAADSNGKSDPYAKFEFNGQEVFKTKTQKKTLNPVWNEFFEMPVPSRTAAKFNVKVYDYDFADRPDFLGGADINLEHLDPFKAKEVKLLLDGKSGSIRLRLLFRPDYVTRSRLGTGTFSGTFGGPGRIVTGVAGAPIKGGAAVVGGIGHGVGKGASFIKRGFTGRSKKDEDASSFSNSEIPTIVENGGSPAPGPGLRRATGFDGGAELPRTPPGTAIGGPANGHHRAPSAGAMSVASVAPSGAGAGTATFQVISASGFPPSADVYVLIRQLSPKEKTVGKTKHHESPSGQIEFNETFKHACTADTQFRIEVKGHHTFGSDDDLGEALFFVSDQAASEKEISVGSGTVVVSSSFTEAASTLSTDSPKGANPMRRSFLSKKDNSRSRETTPS